ncbi:interleukin-21-like isoform X1 [Lates japonicus]
MKLVVLCLFAVYCFSLANTTPLTRRKLEEVLRQLSEVKESLQHSDKMLSAPPENIEDCCCLSALSCFRANLNLHFNITEKKQKKLYKSLNSSITERGLNFCNPGSDTATCQDCDLHPKVNVQEFFKSLESLIQRAITKLTMK